MLIKRTEIELKNEGKLAGHFLNGKESICDRLDNFPRFVRRQKLSTFIYKYELFKKILDVQGSIVEFGVFRGGGLFTFAQLSTILEPYNYQRKVIGFDTFKGFPNVSTEDGDGHSIGDFAVEDTFYDEIKKSIELFDENRFLNHIPKIEVVVGDIMQTLLAYLTRNKHLIVSMAYFDLDLFQPTLEALQMIAPRIPKGGILAFDQVNHVDWPGETLAMLEVMRIPNLRLKRLSHEPGPCYCVVGE